ncbi:MAG: helix-turn-helix domain-containing protein [Actinomycetota bacterium]|nr:helix-turn-helix domain-containing protein [Actinomycetota bacterium]
MSVEAIAWALSVKGLTSTDKLILVTLADHCGPSGECWPGIRRVAAIVGVTERQVRKRLRVLERAGLVSVRERRTSARDSDTNVYQLSLRPPEDRPPVLQDPTPLSSRTPPPLSSATGKPSLGTTNESVQGGYPEDRPPRGDVVGLEAKREHYLAALQARMRHEGAQ